MMKKIEKDGMIYYVLNAYCKDLHDDTSPLQLKQVAECVVSKADNKLVKHRDYLEDMVDNHFGRTHGRSPEVFTLPKKNTDWDTVTEIVIAMVISAIALKDKPDAKLEFKITIGEITVLMTREYDVTYINVMAPRGSGKTRWLTEIMDKQDFDMPVKLYQRGDQAMIGHYSHIMLVDELMPMAVRNKSIVIRVSSSL